MEYRLSFRKVYIFYVVAFLSFWPDRKLTQRAHRPPGRHRQRRKWGRSKNVVRQEKERFGARAAVAEGPPRGKWSGIVSKRPRNGGPETGLPESCKFTADLPMNDVRELETAASARPRPDPLHHFDLTRAIQLPFGGIADAALRFANFVCHSDTI